MSEQVVVENKRSRKKLIITLVSIVLAVAVAVTGTLAYLYSRTGSVVNEFTPTEVTCKVVETFENNVKSNVSIKNTSNIDAFIRVAVIANWVDTHVPPKVTGDTSVLSMEKDHFVYGEDINVTVTGKAKNWVGIYEPGKSGSIRWTYISDGATENQTVTLNIRECQTGGGATSGNQDIPVGTYCIIVLNDDTDHPEAGKVGIVDGYTEAGILAYTTINVYNTEITHGDEIYGKTQPQLNTDYTMDMNLGSDWIEAADGYYYYKYKVAPNANTSVLINECRIAPAATVPEGYTLSVNIIPSAIQSKPDSVVNATWGEANSKVNISANDGVLTVTNK